MDKPKFDFSLEFQFELLRFTVKDRDGYKVLELYDDSYFTLLNHSVIALALKHYFKRKKKIPGEAILIEEVNKILNGKEYINNISKEDKVEILELTKLLFEKNAKDGDDIVEKAEQFAKFVELKDVVENVDLTDFNKYQSFATKIQKAISPKLRDREDRGSFLVADIKDRQFRRQDNPQIYPTPFRQINRLTNAGGYVIGSILVILDKAKKFKTGVLMNLAKGYMKMKKKVLVVDLENGADELSVRLEQSIINDTKENILSGKQDERVQKALRKYKRLGAEIVIKRFPALLTTTNDIDRYMDNLYREYGLRFNVLIVDFAGKLGSTSGKTDDTDRISDVYIDLANLALKYKLEHIWTGQHVKSSAEIREKTRYISNDIAKCLDISRHVQAIWGLNRTEDEENNGILRMEIVDQRDGANYGRGVFKVNYATQRMEEFTVDERKKFDEAWDELHGKERKKASEKPKNFKRDL